MTLLTLILVCAQAEQAQHRQILKPAITVKDILEGTEKFSSVRGRIGLLQGEESVQALNKSP